MAENVEGRAGSVGTSSAATAFMHTVECHTSLLGIRQYALKAGATVQAVPADDLRTSIRPSLSDSNSATLRPGSAGLLAFPAECNFSGNRADLAIVETARRQGWAVLLDAAKFAATSPLDLSSVPADFVTISFYKMFGFPTGLGALIIRNDSIHLLRRPYFGGGTLLAASSFSPTKPRSSSLQNASNSPFFHRLAEHPSKRFEDGTIDFLSIRAVPTGLNLLRKSVLLACHVIRHSLRGLCPTVYEN